VASVRFVPSGVSRGGGPGAGGVFLWRLWPCVMGTTGPCLFGFFWPGFPYKHGNVWFLDSVSLINRAMYGFWIRFSL
jgi:hypothetical protein